MIHARAPHVVKNGVGMSEPTGLSLEGYDWLLYIKVVFVTVPSASARGL